MKFDLNITFSKIMALVICLAAFTLDFVTSKNGTVFMFALPFVVTLITGKQFIDKEKEKNKIK